MRWNRGWRLERLVCVLCPALGDAGAQGPRPRHDSRGLPDGSVLAAIAHDTMPRCLPQPAFISPRGTRRAQSPFPAQRRRGRPRIQKAIVQIGLCQIGPYALQQHLPFVPRRWQSLPRRAPGWLRARGIRPNPFVWRVARPNTARRSPSSCQNFSNSARKGEGQHHARPCLGGVAGQGARASLQRVACTPADRRQEPPC